MRTAHAKARIRQRQETEYLRAVNRGMLLLIAFSLIVLTAFAFFREMGKIDEMRGSLASLKKELAAEELQLLQQQREEKWLNESPEYVETLSRDRLGVMKEGETILRLDEKPVPQKP